jgi:hypothetical protein
MSCAEASPSGPFEHLALLYADRLSSKIWYRKNKAPKNELACDARLAWLIETPYTRVQL